jgi:hypothetical protein
MVVTDEDESRSTRRPRSLPAELIRQAPETGKPMSELDAIGRLIDLGRDPRRSPGRNAAYAELVTRFRGESASRAQIEEVSFGLGLVILDWSPVHGMILASADSESPWHVRLDDHASMMRSPYRWPFGFSFRRRSISSAMTCAWLCSRSRAP